MDKRFGEYIRKAREKAGLKQTQAAEAVSKLMPPKKISQGLVAQYEGGQVILPDATILRSLARIYGIDFSELVFRVALDIVQTYASADDGPLASLTLERLNLWEACLNRFPTVGDVDGLERDLLASKTSLIATAEILNVKGLADWQRRITPLTDYWVITPKFIDDYEVEIAEAVVHNLNRGVHYLYFIRKSDAEKGGRFYVLRSTLARLGSNLEKPLKEQTIDKLVRVVEIDEDDLKWINTDIVIANPLSKNPVGFASIRYQEIPQYGFRLGDRDLATIVARMADYARETKGDNVLTFPPAQSKTKSRSKIKS